MSYYYNPSIMEQVQHVEAIVIMSRENYNKKHFPISYRIDEIVMFINDLNSLLEKAKRKDKKEIEKKIFDLKYELLCLEQPEIIKEIDEIFTS